MCAYKAPPLASPGMLEIALAAVIFGVPHDQWAVGRSARPGRGLGCEAIVGGLPQQELRLSIENPLHLIAVEDIAIGRQRDKRSCLKRCNVLSTREATSPATDILNIRPTCIYSRHTSLCMTKATSADTVNAGPPSSCSATCQVLARRNRRIRSA